MVQYRRACCGFVGAFSHRHFTVFSYFLFRYILYILYYCPVLYNCTLYSVEDASLLSFLSFVSPVICDQIKSNLSCSWRLKKDHLKAEPAIQLLPCRGQSRTMRMKILSQSQTKLTSDYTRRKSLSQQTNLTMGTNHYGYNKSPVPSRVAHQLSLPLAHRGPLRLPKLFPRWVLALLHLMILVRSTRKLC